MTRPLPREVGVPQGDAARRTFSAAFGKAGSLGHDEEMTQRGERLPELVSIMQKLLAPDGCPWDREQTLESLRPYVIEEAHEVVDAIDRKDLAHLREELGDLLLQIVFQSQIQREFGIDDVIGAICDKMIRRHPHVFGDERADDAQAVLVRWESLKAEEKAGRGVLEGVPVAMPAGSVHLRTPTRVPAKKSGNCS
jgi:tetrapyrrole methylase family protein/MazG family protein/ATP diphosphatase